MAHRSTASRHAAATEPLLRAVFQEPESVRVVPVPAELLRAVDVRAVDACERGGEDSRNVLHGGYNMTPSSETWATGLRVVRLEAPVRPQITDYVFLASTTCVAAGVATCSVHA